MGSIRNLFSGDFQDFSLLLFPPSPLAIPGMQNREFTVRKACRTGNSYEEACNHLQGFLKTLLRFGRKLVENFYQNGAVSKTVARGSIPRCPAPHHQGKNQHLQEVRGKPADLTNRSGAVKSVQGRSPNFPKTSLKHSGKGGQK